MPKKENQQLKQQLDQYKGSKLGDFADEIRELKQLQNEKAIEVLEQLRRDIWTDQQDDGWLDEKVDLYYLSETIDNKIKELRSEK